MTFVRRGFRMAPVSITREEDISGYVVQQIHFFGQASIRTSRGNSSYANRQVNWLFPSNLAALAEIPDFGLPSVQVLIRDHTRAPLFRPFLDMAVGEILYSHHVGPSVKGIASTVGANGSITKTQLGICTHCVKADYQGPGYATVKRLFLAPGVLACPTHERPLFSACPRCSEKRQNTPAYMQPTLTCPCGDSLVELRKLDDSGLETAVAISSMAEQILQGRGPSSISPEEIRKAIRQNFAYDFRLPGHSRLTQLRNAVHQAICPEVREYLRLTDSTFIRMTGAGKKTILNPLQNLAIIFAVFGGFEGYTKTLATGQVTAMFQLSYVHQPKGNTKKSRYKKQPMEADYVAWVNSLPSDDLIALREKSRAWLTKLKHKRPGLTRKQLWTKVGRTHSLRFLSWVDKEWLDKELPIIPRDECKRMTIPAQTARDIADVVTQIHGLRRQSMKLRPLKRITYVMLAGSIPRTTFRRLVGNSKELQEAMEACLDTDESWRERVTSYICELARNVDPTTHLCDESTYTGLSYKDFFKRYRGVKAWLHRHIKNSATPR